MITFFVCLAVLIVGYLLYSRFTEKVFGVDDRKTPAIASYDGIDKVPLSKPKAFLIELLNIAGTGPIFGAISGALFGPIAFLWIVIGCLLGGAVHDYLTGMISSRNDGDSIATLSIKVVPKVIQLIMRIFSVLLLILVTAVFVVSPSTLLESLTNNVIPSVVWMIIILAYYLLATIVPVDKVIGKAYPVFGVILILMAVVTLGGIIFQQSEYPMIELIGNLKDFSAQNGKLPWWPFMFTTIACGAVSGFHATQSPMMAKCIKSEKDGRQVFYGAMVAEGIIALIWCAAAMAFFKVNTTEGWQTLNSIGGNSTSVYTICKTVLGPVGTILAVVGVIICPITSGDTALRSARIIIAEWTGLEQKSIKNRLIVTIPLFAVVVGLSIWNFANAQNFNILWRWFAWSNQVLAAVALWISSVYLLKNSRYKFGSLIASIPATIMTAVVLTYILGEPNLALGKFIPMNIAVIVGASISAIVFVLFTVKMLRGKVFKKEIVAE